ncbi:MAG: hypothetical protein Q9169_000026 [Polycauliona sp. 2 TL-2023]
MVATRSQDKEPADVSKASAPAPQLLEKRKRNDDVSSITTPNPPAKKSKIEGESGSSSKVSSRTLAAVVIPTTHQHEANVPSVEVEADAIGSHRASKRKSGRFEEGQLHLSGGNYRIDDNVEPETVGIEREGKDSRSQARQTQTRMVGIKQAASSPKSQLSARKKSKRPNRMEPRTETMSSEGSSALNESREPKHKRFGSEESFPEPIPSRSGPPSPTVPKVQRTAQDVILVSSDDEAPEVVTKSSGQQEARSVAVEATKAIESQRAAEKQRRRDRDLQLKTQAKASKTEAAKLQVNDERLDTSSESDENDRTTSQHQPHENQKRSTSKQRLPALLPEEILAAEPMARLPTPHPRLDVVKAPANTKHRFLDQIWKPPKDIQKGNVRIRVLEDRRAILPPKVSKNSQMLRESWLAGRRGQKGKPVTERRKLGTGFIRK